MCCQLENQGQGFSCNGSKMPAERAEAKRCQEGRQKGAEREGRKVPAGGSRVPAKIVFSTRIFEDQCPQDRFSGIPQVLSI